MTADAATIISDNLCRVQDRIAAAVARSGRSPEEVRLVGVTKYVDAAATAALFEAGCIDLGESRPQQLWQKAASPQLRDLPIRWHQIGHLQRNKVAKTVSVALLIHTADSDRLLRAINDAVENDANSAGPADVLLEINTSGDAEKHGLTAEVAHELMPRLPEFPNCRVLGLMTMAAREGGPTVARQNFAALRELRDQLRSEAAPLNELSMGMSGDFEEAIAEGSTVVRVGSALWERLR
ncbi:MAG: YggS family pyridoxal phosphate-dependent enzyme [Planctomycetota bacterium]